MAQRRDVADVSDGEFQTSAAIGDGRPSEADALLEPLLSRDSRRRRAALFALPLCLLVAGGSKAAQIADEPPPGMVTSGHAVLADDYSAATLRLRQEMVRLLREQDVLVVWLLDESDSMKDDRQEIAQIIPKKAEELRAIQHSDPELKKAGRTVLTAVVSYGETIHPLTEKPTADLATILAAIKNVPANPSGKENMCTAIRETVKLYRKHAVKQRRKLLLVVATDESGDDFMLVEDALAEAKRANAPIYILGREAVFGYPFARIRWYDPRYRLPHWLTINRGPETAFLECLQWDGLHGRWDAFPSGCGPYEQSRSAKESGGLMFLLPGGGRGLASPKAHTQRAQARLPRHEGLPAAVALPSGVQSRGRPKPLSQDDLERPRVVQPEQNGANAHTRPEPQPPRVALLA